MKAFKAYDIRGVYNEDFNKEDVYKIGYFIPKLLKADKVLVGRDDRVSSPEIFEYLAKGITDAGATVYDAGLTTTPMVYWGTAKYDYPASVMITASHNPANHNGLKISRKDVIPVGYDTGLSQIESWMKSEKIVCSAKKGAIIKTTFIEEYISFQKQYLRDISNLNIGVDCSNGMAGLLIKNILKNQPHYIFDEIDCTFPNHEPNPLNPKNIVDIQNLVKSKKCDIGVIYDGDADRVMFVDELGKFISPDLIIAVLAHYFVEIKGEKGTVLQDIRTSKAVGEYLQQFDCPLEIWRVGRAYAAIKLREINGLWGGELAGHYYFRDFYYSDSGIMASLIVLGIVADFKRKGISLSELISKISCYKNSGEINFRIEQKQKAMDAVKKYFMEEEKATAFFDFDGYRIEFPDWWLNIRPSNTEPYLRFLAEANKQEVLEEKVAKVKEIIATFS